MLASCSVDHIFKDSEDPLPNPSFLGLDWVGIISFGAKEIEKRFPGDKMASVYVVNSYDSMIIDNFFRRRQTAGDEYLIQLEHTFANGTGSKTICTALKLNVKFDNHISFAEASSLVL